MVTPQITLHPPKDLACTTFTPGVGICELGTSGGFLAYLCLKRVDPEEMYWPAPQGGLGKCNPNVGNKSDRVGFVVVVFLFL